MNSRPSASTRTSSWRSGFLPQSKTAFDVELRIILDEECYQNSVAPGEKLGTPALWFDPCAFAVPPAGFYGNLGRGTLIGPGTVNFDMSLGKSIPLKWEASRLEFRSEFFNLFNRPNFADPANQVLNANNNALISTTGQITKTVTSSRQVQFALKLVF